MHTFFFILLLPHEPGQTPDTLPGQPLRRHDQLEHLSDVGISILPNQTEECIRRRSGDGCDIGFGGLYTLLLYISGAGLLDQRNALSKAPL